jgi:hypothetical protein
MTPGFMKTLLVGGCRFAPTDGYQKTILPTIDGEVPWPLIGLEMTCRHAGRRGRSSSELEGTGAKTCG